MPNFLSENENPRSKTLAGHQPIASKSLSSLHPHHPRRLEPQIRHLAFFGTRCAGVVQAADFQSFFALFGAAADAGDFDAAGVKGGAGQRVHVAARVNYKKYKLFTLKPVRVNIFYACAAPKKQKLKPGWRSLLPMVMVSDQGTHTPCAGAPRQPS